MAQYYAIERSPNYLTHYGIKGMRWGVRKAIEKGNASKIAKHYTKAQKKLKKLNDRADVSYQKKQQAKYAKRSGIGFGIGALGATGALGAGVYQKLLANRYTSAHNAFYKNMDSRIRDYEKGPGNPAYWKAQTERHTLDRKLKSASKDLIDKGNIADKVNKAAMIVNAAGIGYGGYAGARSLLAKHRTSQKGHAEAVTKRDAWKHEMDKTFKNAKVDKLSKRDAIKLKRANVWADAYRSSIKDLQRQNDSTDIFEKRNNKFINKWNKKLKKHEAKARSITRYLK